jgi:hypothetical protein
MRVSSCSAVGVLFPAPFRGEEQTEARLLSGVVGLVRAVVDPDGEGRHQAAVLGLIKRERVPHVCTREALVGSGDRQDVANADVVNRQGGWLREDGVWAAT